MARKASTSEIKAIGRMSDCCGSLGMLLIINYYVGVLPGGRSGYYLLGGLAAVTAGFGVATQLK